MRRVLPSLLLATSLYMPLSALAAPASSPAKLVPPLVGPQFTNLALESSTSDGARVYSQADPSALVSGIALFLHAGVDRQEKLQGGIAALTAEIVLDTPVNFEGTLMPLQAAVSKSGGAIVSDVEGQSVRFYLEARNAQLADMTKLFAAAIAAPAFDQTTFQAAQAMLRARVKALRSNALTAGASMYRDAFYSNSNAGQPPLGTLADLDRASASEAASFFHAAYRRGGASATIVGDVSEANKVAAKSLLLALTPGDSQPARVIGRQPLLPQTTIMSFRNISAPWIVLGFPAPSAASDDFGAMFVLNSILQDALVRASTTTVPYSQRPVGLEYDFYSNPATAILYVDGAAADSAFALRELTVLRNELGSKAFTDDDVNHFKRMAEGQYITYISTPSQRALEISSLANLGLGVDGINVVLKKIESVKLGDVQRVLTRYFDAFTPVSIMPSDQEDR